MIRISALAWLCAVSFAAFADAAETSPVATVSSGTIQGAIENGNAVFKGIPYAAPPVGDLRWREPQAPQSWSGTRDAREFGAACIQGRVDTESEDCLTLNVWAPEWPSTGKKAVMIWIHGGGNTEGWTSTPYYSGEALAKRSVVVVSIQYRLGMFGFFAHPDLDKESPHRASGNYGLLDQIAALKWVKANIAAFGGDPGNVTVFGESAGAEDIGVLLASPLSEGLFARAIAESGPLRRIYPTLEEQERGCMEFAQLFGKDGGDIAGLRSVPAAEVLSASFAGMSLCKPINLDGYVLTDQPLKAYADGRQMKVPFMLGNTLREGFVAMPPSTLRQTIRVEYGNLALRVLEAYGIEGSVMPPSDPVYGDTSVQYGTDQAHRCRVALTGIQHAATGQPFYQFQFARDFRGVPNRSTHTDEIPFVFGAPALELMRLNGPGDVRLSEAMQRYWTNFAKTGDPNGPGLPHWSAFDASRKAYITFTTGGPAAGERLRAEQCDLFLRAEKERPTWQYPERANR
jgi:para-nitrobenzyl esterase